MESSDSRTNCPIRRDNTTEDAGNICDNTQSRDAIDKLEDIQNELEILNDRVYEEIMRIEQAHSVNCKPLYAERSRLLQEIPRFWITALNNHPDIGYLISDFEEDCLEYLDSINVTPNEIFSTGYTISFKFMDNPYFTNNILTREFRKENGEAKIKISEINWKDGMDLRKYFQKKQNAKINRRSFFEWFLDIANPNEDDLSEVIKDDLWVNPLQYYLIGDKEGNDVSSNDDYESDDSEEMSNKRFCNGLGNNSSQGGNNAQQSDNSNCTMT